MRGSTLTSTSYPRRSIRARLCGPEAVAPGAIDQGLDAEIALDRPGQRAELLALQLGREVAGIGETISYLLDMRRVDPGMEMRADVAHARSARNSRNGP